MTATDATADTQAYATNPTTTTTIQDTAGVTIPAAEFDFRQNDAIVTIHNPATGNHRTFRIRTLRGKWHTGRRVLAILNGSDNTRDYKDFAWVNDGKDNEGGQPSGIEVFKKYHFWNNTTGRIDPKTGRAGVTDWERYAKMVAEPVRYMEKGLQYMVAARCFRCGRALTRPESISGGIGPECRRKGN